jgi:hypothetical protein
MTDTPEGTPQILLAHHLKALKLPTFLREYDKLARQCAADAVDHVRYLLRLAELELIERERRMVERRINEGISEAAPKNSLLAPWPRVTRRLGPHPAGLARLRAQQSIQKQRS